MKCLKCNNEMKSVFVSSGRNIFLINKTPKWGLPIWTKNGLGSNWKINHLPAFYCEKCRRVEFEVAADKEIVFKESD